MLPAKLANLERFAGQFISESSQVEPRHKKLQHNLEIRVHLWRRETLCDQVSFQALFYSSGAFFPKKNKNPQTHIRGFLFNINAVCASFFP